MSTASLRARYLGDSVATASPQQLLVMLYDRLALDLQRGETALTAGDREGAHVQLMHAQEIVLELQSALRLDVWDGAAGLSAIYTWLHRELVRANVQRDVTATTACLDLVLPLADAWREAALVAAAV